MVVGDIDLRLLRVFRTVVEAGGFSNAQALLNTSQSTISTQMSQLEIRLGYRLCERGRSGFRLTEQGDLLYRYAVQLFQSLQQFQLQAEELKRGLSGHLRIGILDAVITDPACPVSPALREFSAMPNNVVRISVEVLPPRELETQLLDKRLDVAFGTFCSFPPALSYKPLYRERDVLVCHRDHPLARMAPGPLLDREISRTRKVIRTFLGKQELIPLNTSDDTIFATVENVEAAALLVQSGAYIGFLPEHYVRAWVERGDMVVLMRDQYVRYSDFSMATRALNPTPTQALTTFLECVDVVHEGMKLRHPDAYCDQFDPADVNVEAPLLKAS